MALKFFNYLGRQIQDFTPLIPGQVEMYTCGPTVYDFVHLGNWRTFTFEDLLKRTLRYAGFKVKQVMNITDVDDKIIKRAASENTNLKSLTKHYTELFFQDRDKLNILPADVYPQATDHIPQMISLIEKLIAKGLAYESEGSVYYAIKNFSDYGKLSQLKFTEQKSENKTDQDEYVKDSASDFALWKASKEGEPKWDSPWGPGRPGWHIECSAMSMEHLHPTFDIHAGGIDLLFPHHENEIAQSEGATGQPFAKYWLEGEHLMMAGEKMSKSLGNIFTLKTIEEKNFSPLALRYLFLTAHYRQTLNFTWESLGAAQNALSKLENLMRDWLDIPAGKILEDYQKKFTENLENDLSLPQALATMWEMVNDSTLLSADKKATLLNFDQVLGLSLDKIKPTVIPAEVETLLISREKARAENDFAKADELRAEIMNLGFVIEDSPTGPKLRQK